MYFAISYIMLSLFSMTMLSMLSICTPMLKFSMSLYSNTLMFLFAKSLSKEIFYFLQVVMLITMIISVYSFFYLGLNYKTINFMWTLSFFAFSMMLLILADSMMMYILGWDGLGVSSFLLILFYNTLFSYRSGLATFLTNRLGDVFIIMSFIIMASKENIITNMQSFPLNNGYLKLSFFLLLLGAATKSAQLPFSAWLPAAMAAPTPVSALVHSSTLVTAGIFLLYRFDKMSDCVSSMTSGLISLLGIILSLLAGFMAFFETDLKKLVAMSTLSQLGILIYILFQKQSEITLIHIMSHAFFKSLLFLVVGFLIFLGMGVQDARTKTSIKVSSNISMVLLVLSSLSLMGFVFMPGFFSKDLILVSYPEQGLNMFIYLSLLMSCVMTVLYSAKSFVILMNNMQLSQATSHMDLSNKFTVPALFLFSIMMTFGVFFFFFIIESEAYTINFCNKVSGILIILSGMVMILLHYSAKKNMNITKTKKMTAEILSQMMNMNWISNNFLSSVVGKIYVFMKMENLWMENMAENKTTQMATAGTTSFSKKIKKFTSMESVMFFMSTLTTVLLMSLNL